MEFDSFGQVILNEEDILEGLYSGELLDLGSIHIRDKSLIDQYNSNVLDNVDDFSLMKSYVEPSCTIEEFDKERQEIWFMPDEYKSMDVGAYIRSLCNTDGENKRVDRELFLYDKHGMMNVLRFLKYLMDVIRDKHVVLGVGRGSSVASYCLYLLGVHKIDSLKYELDLEDFFKEN